MTNPQKENLADALTQLASGGVVSNSGPTTDPAAALPDARPATVDGRPSKPNRPARPLPVGAATSIAGPATNFRAEMPPAQTGASFTRRQRSVAIHARMGVRRTIIPILLTMGTALIGCALWWMTLDPDSPLKLLGLRFPITLAVVGLTLLALGIVNVIQVKHQLAASPLENTNL